MIEALLVSTGVVALAEIGDKTQLLALLLAARFRKPWPIVAGILAATLLNHALAGLLGAWITSWLSPGVLRWVLGVSFLAMAAWTLIPDKIEDDEAQFASRLGVFGATFVSFFLAEMGDKTQIATVPVVFVGDRLAQRIPMQWVHRAAAALFALLGVAALMGLGQTLLP